MIPYLIFIITILIAFHFKAHKVMFFIMTLFAALRLDVGWDYASYIDICTDSTRLENAQEAYSYVWYLLFNFAYNNAIPEFPIILCAVITQLCIYKAFKIFLNNDNLRVSEALLVYICWPFFYLSTFSIIRQSLAISIVLLAFALLSQQQKTKAIALWAAAVYLHPSAFFSFPVAIILAMKERLTLKSIIICISASTILLLNIKDSLLLLNTPFLRYIVCL